MSIQTNFTISLSGEGQVTRLDKKTSFLVQEKLEKTLVINNESVALDYSQIDNPSLFVFEGDGIFNVTITTATDEIVFAIDGSFTFTPTATFIGTVTGIAISETASTDVTIGIRVYSKQASA